MASYANTGSSAHTAVENSTVGRPDAAPAASTRQKHSKGRLRLHLEDLPNEILIRVFQYVETSFYDSTNHRFRTGVQSVLNLAVCSSRFHRLLDTILYSNAVIKHDSGAKKPPGFPTFLCRILARPELARQVRSLHAVARGSDFADGGYLDASNLTDPERRRIRAAVQAASESQEEAEGWINGIERGAWDSMTALVLFLAPNIAELELEFENWNQTDNSYPFLIRLFERATGLQETDSLALPLSLRSLQRISTTYRGIEGGFPIDLVIPLLRLKSLSAFHGHQMRKSAHRNDGGPPAWLSSRPTFTTKDLKLSRSGLGHDSIPSFLRCFPTLERLHYEYGGLGVSNGHFEPPRMMAALEQLRSHLKELTLLGGELPRGSDLESCPVGSFSCFAKLTSIDAFATLLIGNGCLGKSDRFQRCQDLVRVVPPSLESLTLRRCGDINPPYIRSQVSHLVLQKASIAPALKWIVLEWDLLPHPDKPRTAGPVVHPGFTKAEMAQLLKECENAGIQLKVKYRPPPPKAMSYYVPHMEKRRSHWASYIFLYPYEGYEECCEEHGCDPETGDLRFEFFLMR